VYPSAPDLLYAFLGCKTLLSKPEVEQLLQSSGLAEDAQEDALRLLCWFGILGVRSRSLSVGPEGFSTYSGFISVDRVPSRVCTVPH